ncbi:MAG: DUF262 domain-containing protein [Verrucomicrobiota bacterium]
MLARSITIEQLLKGPKVFQIPVFQRHYQWLSLEKDAGGQVLELWTDICERCLKGKNHFLGSIVTQKIISKGSETIPRFIIIDGQQRIITLLTLLSVIRDYARHLEHSQLVDHLNQHFLLNPNEAGQRKLRLVASQTNRDHETLSTIINGNPLPASITTHPIHNSLIAFQSYIQRYIYTTQIDQQANALETLLKLVSNNLIAVEIQLEKADNPALIFQSLNSKGLDLAQSDLCRSYIFMKLSSPALQKRMHGYYWSPIEERLLSVEQDSQESKIDTFLKDVLSIENPVLRERNIYHELEEKVGETDFQIESFLIQLSEFSIHYQTIYDPSNELSENISKQLLWLKKFDCPALTPTLLTLFFHFRTKSPLPKQQKLKETEFNKILQLLESLLVRRFICQLSTSKLALTLHKIIQDAIKLSEHAPFFESLIKSFTQDYIPDNQTVKEALETRDFNSTGIQAQKLRYIFQRIEAMLSNNAQPPQKAQSLEHIMPYSLTNWWKKEIGEKYSTLHQPYLNHIGNITLVPYRATLSNRKFPEKKILLKESGLYLNKYFSSCKKWKINHIRDRTKILSEHILDIWKRPTDL